MAVESEIVNQKVTASLSTEVSFNPQVADADTAIKSRNEATKNARAKWLKLVSFFDEHNINMSRRRGTTDNAYGNIKSIRVYKPRVATDEEIVVLQDKYEALQILGDDSTIRNLMAYDDTMEALETAFTGFGDFLRSQIADCKVARKAYLEASKTPAEDKKATAAAREEATKLADEFSTAMDALEDSAEVLSGVRDYIGVVESIANISAVANSGRQQ